MSISKIVVDVPSAARRARTLCLIAVMASATTAWAVDRVVPDQYASIQAAIDASTNGDTVLVRRGNYSGRVDLRGRRITLKGEDGPGATIIDAQGQSGVVVNCDEGETNQTIIDGFTIRNGLDSGLYVSGASPVIRNCWFVNNQASRGGGAHIRASSNVSFTDCRFTSNLANSGEYRGGAVYAENSTVLIKSTTFIGNEARKPVQSWTDTSLHPRGGAISSVASNVTIEDSSSSANLATMNWDTAFCGGNAAYYLTGGFVQAEGGGLVIRRHQSEGDKASGRILDLWRQFCNDRTSIVDCRGGFVHLGGGATLALEDSTIQNASAESVGQGGGDYFNDVYVRCFGGALFLTGGNTTITRTTISSPALVRTFVGNNGGAQESNGGAIYHEAGTLTVSNSEILNASGLDHGGAIFSDTSAAISLQATTLRNCFATGRGGAIYNTKGGTWNFSNVKFENCTAQNGNGGAIWLTGGTRTFTDCTFTHNLSQGSGDVRGGGIYAEGGALLSLTRTDFTNNRVAATGNDAERVARGGATAFIGCTPVYDRCRFESNSATASGNGGSTRRAHGGATWEYDSDARYTDCSFVTNKAETTGTGDRESYGGGVYLWNSDSKFLRCKFDDDRALPTSTRAYGGGVYMEQVSRPALSYSTFTGCDAANGAGAYINNSEPYFTSVAFRENAASSSGGGLFVDNLSTPYVLGCTFERNDAPSGGAVKTIGSGTNLPFIVNTSFCGSGLEPVSGSILGGAGNIIGTACSTDCDGDGVSDADEIAAGTANDADGNGVPDTCQPDCNGNGSPDAYELSINAVPDCNGNGRPDSCDIAAGSSQDSNSNGIPDECELTSARLVPFEYSSIQSAINASVNGDTIFVAPGAYYEKFSLGSKQITLKSIGGRELTYIDGNGTNGTLLTIDGGQTASTVIDGFTFWYAQGGWAIRIANASPVIRNCRLLYNSYNTDGAALRIESPSTAAITDCVIDSNTANMGGGLWTNANPVLTRATFTNNTANDDGGAVRIVSPSTGIRFIDSTFSGNKAQGGGDHRGGAVYATNAANPSFTNCSFTSNLASSAGDGSDRVGLGGAVAFADCTRNDPTAPDVFTDCTFTTNSSRTIGNGGGTRYSFGGAIYDWNSDIRYQRCTFSGNKAESASNAGRRSWGGTIYNAYTDPRIENCAFIGNASISNDSGDALGGAIFYEATSNGTVQNCNFQGNSAYRAGAVYLFGNSQPNIRLSKFTSNSAADRGGAVYANGSPGFFDSGEFRLNTAPTGSAVYVEGTPGPTLYFCTLCGNAGTDIVGQWTNSGSSIDAFCADCNGNGFEDADDISAGRTTDCDSNGVPDSCQLDSDGDGLINVCDACPNNPLKTTPGACGCESADTDTDTDGVANCVDSDDDGDGVTDDQDAFPLDRNEAQDTDADGVGDNSDPDADGDGVLNAQDRCPLVSNPDQADFDADGTGDACDDDDDGDGTPDASDGCPFNAMKTAAGACGCDRAEADSDGDGIADCIDNCPALANASQADCNGDGVGDACTQLVDCNGNGVNDLCDIAAGASDVDRNGVLDDCQPDCNSNGLPDSYEIAMGTITDCNSNGVPDTCDLVGSPSSDVDGNGTLDECEPDCNGDGLIDADQIASGEPDCDGNGLLDECQDRSIRASTGNVGPFHSTAPLTTTLQGLSPATRDVQVRIAVSADLSATNEFVWLQVNGIDITTPSTKYFVTGGSDCPTTPNRVTAIIARDRWNQLVSGTTATVTLRASPSVDAAQCPDSWALLSIRVLTAAGDCDQDGLSDLCEIASGSALDCDGDRKPDACAIASGLATDCNGNGVPDRCDIASNPALDCDTDGIIDACAIAAGTVMDCNQNGRPDSCDIAGGIGDCNSNGMLDTCEIANGTLQDCDRDGVPDVCELVAGTAQDCNANGLPDNCDIAEGRSADIDENEIPDECALDCNGNGLPDPWEISSGRAGDCNGNGTPDSCDISTGLEQDCNANGIPDACDLIRRTSSDLDANGIPDECAQDCNANGIPDAFEVSTGYTPDCNANGIPDGCEIAANTVEDCNLNGAPDPCDILQGAADENANQRIDDCEIAGGDFDLNGSIDTADLSFLLLFWNEVNPPIGDLDGSGMCDGGDLALLLLMIG
ncbi:MAG: thrombospondin type 3 repeat-containing protein [Phycisphaerales bacterium]